MDNKNSIHIKQLIENSGLLSFHKTIEKVYENFDFTNQTILITGAAGSIGSELTKQLLACKFKKLILIDIAESPLYNLMKSVENENLSAVEFLLLNIAEDDRLNMVFETHKPTIIFHTAAYKHVPLMELHPFEAVKTNILATKVLTDLSIKYKVKKFIFISTDKAVNPINSMGVSKRIAEKYILQVSKNSNVQFAIARFGNIIGSNGSVLPLFIKQMESGLPLTVTDESATRYFIGKQKACHLILKLATLHKMDSILFTFNMGNPIKIIDLAKSLISFYQDKTVEIKIIGLRPAEKQVESIISNNEFLTPITNSEILLVKNKQEPNFETIDLSGLMQITSQNSAKEIKRILLTYL